MSKGSPSPRSPYIMTKISPKSPYIMAMKSPKSPVLCEKYKSGCAWGLISIFDFRQGRPSKKLISDRRSLNRHNTNNGQTRSRLNVLSGVDEKYQNINDGLHNKTLPIGSAKESIKRLMEKEISTEQKIKKSTTAVGECVQPDSSSAGHSMKHKTKSKPGLVSVNGCKDAAIVGHRQPSNQVSVDEFLHKLDSAAMADSLCNQCNSRHRGDYGCAKKGINCSDYKQLVQMNDLAEAYVNQKFIDGKILSGGDSQSKQFLDALQILNSNKELFLKLLHDPNSFLVKHIEDLRDSQVQKQATDEAKLPEHHASNVRQCEEPDCTQKIRKQNMRDIILKKIKFRDSYPAKGVGDHKASDEIVVLKPGPSSLQNDEISHCSSLQSHSSSESEGQSARPTSFTLGGIRRKLRHAVGASRKEQRQFSINDTSHKTSRDCLSMEDSGNETGREMVGRSLLSETDFETGGTTKSSLDVKRRDKVGRTKSSESSIEHGTASTGESGLKNSLTVSRHKQNDSNEPRNGNEGKNLPTEGVPKTQGRTLSLPEYDFLHVLSPIRGREHGSATAQMRFCACTDYHMVKENRTVKNEKSSSLRENVEVPSSADSKKPNDQMQICDSKPNNSDNTFTDTKAHESTGSVRIVETSDSICSEEINLLEVPSEPDGSCISGANGINYTANTCGGYEEFSSLDSPPPLDSDSTTSSLEVSSSGLLSIQKVEDVNITKDGAEQPSPVSVLELFCIDDASSPANALSRSAELPVQPQEMSFEEECSALVSSPLDWQRTLSTPMDEHGSLTEYVRSILQAASLDWDELSLKCNSSDQLLEPSLYDEFGVSCSDHGLLFDCINEILVQVYQHYFRCSPWISLMKPHIRPLSVDEHVVNEVVKCFNCYLLPQQLPKTMEPLVKTDLAKSVTWMDIRLDAEDTIAEMVEDVLEDIIMETVSEMQF